MGLNLTLTDPLLALQNFKSSLYFLLVIDIKMPKIDGFELFDRIEKEDNKVKICLFSASWQLTSNYKKLFQSSLYISLCVVGYVALSI